MKNLLEDTVAGIYEDLLAKMPAVCGCASCREDALAYVLNKTRPRYSGGTDTGMALIALDLQKDQTRAQLAVIVLDAIKRVGANPRHPSS
ncbi:MAG: late competence development ComFB family protein [Gemmatimonadota bacterium]